MKIKCIDNRYESLPMAIKNNMRPSTFYIDIDQEYVVYAVTEFYENIWYCIFSNTCSSYPIWYPSAFFEIKDPRLSRYWIFSFVDTVGAKKGPFLGISEWAKDSSFYSNLLDWEEKEVKVFGRYRNIIDLEFPDETVVDNAQIGDEMWLICPKCMDAWKYPDNKDALVVCPKCYLKYNNPRYVNEYPLLLNKNYDFI